MACVCQPPCHLLYMYLLFDLFILGLVFVVCVCIIVSQCIAGGGRSRNLSEWLVSAAKQEEETHLLTPFS